MKAIGAQLEKAEDTQISLTDPDARSMEGTGKATGTVGYNVQCAVETKHHLIIAHEVTNAVHDRHQLSSMAGQAKEALGAEAIEALADRGYYDGKEILACGRAGVTDPCTGARKASHRSGADSPRGTDYNEQRGHSRLGR
jgi:hypothetical protein